MSLCCHLSELLFTNSAQAHPTTICILAEGSQHKPPSTPYNTWASLRCITLPLYFESLLALGNSRYHLDNVLRGNSSPTIGHMPIPWAGSLSQCSTTWSWVRSSQEYWQKPLASGVGVPEVPPEAQLIWRNCQILIFAPQEINSMPDVHVYLFAVELTVGGGRRLRWYVITTVALNPEPWTYITILTYVCQP